MTIQPLDSQSLYLDFTQRPSNLQDKISIVFNQLANKENSEWLYNGSEKYQICQIDEHGLMKKII